MKEFLTGCVLILIIGAALAAFEGWIASLLWNWLAPLFWENAPVLGIWQAFGILVLINIIFGVFKSKK